MNVRFYLSYDIKITLKFHFRLKNISQFRNYVRNIVTCMDVKIFPENLLITSGLWILLHGVISLPDATS